MSAYVIMSYVIEPITTTETITTVVRSVIISISELRLGEWAKVRVDYYGDNQIVYYTEDLMEGLDYQAWGSDDQYPINWVCAKRNIVII